MFLLFDKLEFVRHYTYYLIKKTTIAQMKTKTAVPMLKYATLRLEFHWVYAWQSIVIPIKGKQILIAWFQISNICNTAKTTTDRLASISIIVTILCNKGASFHFDFIVNPPCQVLIYQTDSEEEPASHLQVQILYRAMPKPILS